MMEGGVYTLTANDVLVSLGDYAFNGTEVEFFAREGVTFHAMYDAARQVIEGLAIPTHAEEETQPIAATLTIQ